MSCCEYGQCTRGQDCPVRAPAANQVASLRPMYRLCDVMGVCQNPDFACKANCLMQMEAEAVSETLVRTFADWLLLAVVTVAAVVTVSFVLGLYADHISTGLLWLADGVTRLVQRFAGLPLGWN